MSGRDGISSMTNYNYSDTFYKAICDEQSVYKRCSFPTVDNKQNVEKGVRN